MANILPQLIAGLGLFFLGLHTVTANLHQTSGRRFRTLIAHFTDRPWLASALGFLSGAVLQSTSAVAVILASMTASGLVSVRRALPIVAWANVGTTVLIFVAALDIRLAVLYLLGLSGICFSFSREARWRSAYGIVLGISLLFFGLDVMKSGAAGLQQLSWFRAVLEGTRGSFALACLGGAFLSFLTQSSTAVTLLAVTLVNTGLLGVDETIMVIYGGNVGSTFSRMILASGLKGSSRQIGRFLDLFKIAGTALFVLLFYVEWLTDVPLVKALVESFGVRVETQMALVNLLYNLTMAVVLCCLLGPVQRLLERFWPASDVEDFAKVQYLHPQALSDAETALDLVEKEQMRLVNRLPLYLDALRDGDTSRRKVDPHALHQAFLVLSKEVESYLTAMIHLQLSVRTSERLTNVQGRHSLIGLVEDNVYHLVGGVRQGPPSARLAPLVDNFVEALDFLLQMAGEAAATLSAEEGQLLANLCADRGDLMGKIRNLYLSSEHDLGPRDKSLLLDLTGYFDRIVWVVRRFALLLEQNRQYRA
jgi:phosphate:Na+ symporter